MIGKTPDLEVSSGINSLKPHDFATDCRRAWSIWTANMLTATLDDFGCPECQTRHVLCFESDSDATPDPKMKYQYMCPKTRP
jgi:hypothetical protein